MQPHDVRILRGAAIPTLAAGLLAVLIGLLAAGADGAVGAVLGMAVVMVFFAASMLAVGYASSISPQIMMPAAMLTYIIKIFAMLGLIVLLRDASWMHPKVFALTVVACTLVWLGAEMRAFVKQKILYVDPAPTPDKGGEHRNGETAGVPDAR